MLGNHQPFVIISDTPLCTTFACLVASNGLPLCSCPLGHLLRDFLIFRTADHDDRVVPSHTLKYAAQLYHYLKRPDVKLIQRNPVLARVETDAGHGAGKPRDKVVGG